MINKNIYIISGGPGFGKTSIIENLSLLGYNCSGEYARELINSQKKAEGDILPWKNPKKFQQEILKLRLNFFNSITEQSVAFTDRAIPDQLAFANYNGFEKPDSLIYHSKEYRYADMVFICPPWPEIYKNDDVRKETFEEAALIHNFLVKVYTELNYDLIELPLIDSTKRAEFILDLISKK